MENIKIKGSGYYLPKKMVTNDDLSKIVDTNDEWITSRTGIKTRYFSEDEDTSVLSSKAALKAIENANIDKNDIDLIIVCTMTPDNFTPSVACLVQEYLGIKDAMAFDVNAACSGFIYGLHIASNMLNANNFKNALVIGSEVLSKILDFNDRATCILFGDGAGAVVISKDESKKAHFYSRSKADENKVILAKGLNLTKDFMTDNNTDFSMKMKGQEVFKFAVGVVDDAISNILNIANLNIDDIDLIIPHQANIRIIDFVAKKMNIDASKFYTNVSRVGNTSAASVAIALAMAIEENKITTNQKILLVGFGAGLTWSSAIIEV